MSVLYEDIRGYAGISDIEYLEEGIVFFKNSSKIKRLGKNLSGKQAKLIKKGDMENAKAIGALVQEINSVSNKFETVEQKYKAAKGKEAKTAVRKDYKELETMFSKLVKVAKKDSTKRALIAAGGLAVVVGIIAAGIFGIMTLDAAGSVEGAAENIGTRLELGKINRMGDTEVLNKLTGGSSGNKSLDAGAAMVARGGANLIGSQMLRQTNQDLVKTATVVGATAGGVLSVPLIAKLKKMGQKNKTIRDTVLALEELKNSDKPAKKQPEGDSEK